MTWTEKVLAKLPRLIKIAALTMVQDSSFGKGETFGMASQYLSEAAQKALNAAQKLIVKVRRAGNTPIITPPNHPAEVDVVLYFDESHGLTTQNTTDRTKQG
ncbi:hypothetical protein BU17DRAFT_63931 [Hysterangium stoloniferum]|nr:hypothetical protein BU17DRAFT_63931 [Hysterangium stoloniferum]